MAKIYQDLSELIGNTPLMEVKNIEKAENLKARLLVKIESFNPGGSVKDRIALAMIEDAEKSGKLLPGAVIIEPTSGNTGIGLAWVASVKGYKLILTMPETMSVERQNLLKALGATLVLTPGSEELWRMMSNAACTRCSSTPIISVMLRFFRKPPVELRTVAKKPLRLRSSTVSG